MSSSSNNKRSSIVGYLTDKNSDDLNLLKEFHDNIQQNNKSNYSFTEENLKTNLKMVLESCVQRNNTVNSSMNKKNDLSFKILELLNSKEHKILFESFKLPHLIMTLLDKTFFDKLLNLFQSSHPEVSLKLVETLIRLLENKLHQNLSIINPLLQIMELAFKHSNREVKAFSYNCWRCLINNFALEREFFLKPKKFSLLLMPLLNKCKTYKEEDVCKCKALAWLSLIENLNEKLPNYMGKVFLPFLNYCFGLNQLNENLTTDEDSDEKKIEKFSKLLGSDLKPEHNYDSLNQIGFEVFVSFIFNGQLELLNEDLKNKFKYVNLKRDFKVNSTLTDQFCWLSLVKYFFQLMMTKINTSIYESSLLYQLWRRIGNFLALKSIDNSNELDPLVEKEWNSNDKNQNEKIVNENIIEYYLDCSIQIVLKTNYASSKLNNENRFIIQFATILTVYLKNEYPRILNQKSHFKSEILKFIKISSKILLSSNSSLENEESGILLCINNMNNLLSLISCDTSLIELINWLDLSNKFYDHLRLIKTKQNIINLNESNYEAINLCIIFPFKYYKCLEIQDSDIKLIVNSCNNLAKSISGLIKQNRIKLENNHDISTVNNWLMCLVSKIGIMNNDADTSSCLGESLSLDLDKIDTQEISNKNLFKILQIQAQVCLYILQNIFEFDIINQQNNIESSSSSSFMKSLNEYSYNNRLSLNNKIDSFNYLFSLIELIKKQIKYFYDYIKSQSNNFNMNNETSETNNSENSNNQDEPSNVETPKSASKSHENKLAIQLYCNLIEQLSVLFTRIKSHQLLDKFLIQLSDSIELITELNSISKQLQTDANTIQASSASPIHLSANKKSKMPGLLNSHHSAHNFMILLSFQATRRSNDLYDTFSMQIASYIQNNLNKSQPTKSSFDSTLLAKLEPIFYSFLKYSTKISLKQKTLQAWNSTFGKSTEEKLIYTPRLEKLFIELKEEMINKSRSSGSGSGSSSGVIGLGSSLVAISLPGLKPIDILHTNNTTTSETMNENIAYKLSEEEKENSSNNINLNSNQGDNFLAFKEKSNVSSSLKESLLNDSSSSVPMAQLVNLNPKQPLKQQQQSTIPVPKSPITITANFVFSPVGRSTSFLNTVNHGTSLSASKINNVKTPESILTSRSSPRSLRHNSKRKLDLNGLIDQMPDKDFVEINNKPQVAMCNLFKNFETVKNNSPKLEQKKEIDSKSKSDFSVFKQPLTEHQKEMKRKKSFIPFEMQSAIELDNQTMDSQMSCTNDDTNSQLPFNNNNKKESPSINTKNNSILNRLASLENDENANDKMDLGNDENNESEKISKQEDVKEKMAANIPPSTINFSTPPSIKFHSKLNPKKEIELFEVTGNQQSTQKDQDKQNDNVELSNQTHNVIEQNKLANLSNEENNEKVSIELTNENDSNKETFKRRSARLKSKEEPPINNTNTSLESSESNHSKIELGECLTITGEQIASSIVKDPSNMDSKTKITNKSKKQKLSKLERIKFQSRMLRKNKKIEKTPNDIAFVKKTHEIPLKCSSSNSLSLFKVNYNYKLKKKMNNNRKKWKKYKNLIRKFKSSMNDSDKLFKKTNELNKIKSQNKTEIINELNKQEEKKEEKILQEKVVEEKIVEKLEVNLDNDDDEDDIPLSRIMNKKKRERRQSVENQQLNDITSQKNQNNQDETNKSAQKEIKDEKPTSADLELVTSSPAQIQAKTPSEIVSAAIQKLNDTPTSILKKRPTSRLTIHGVTLPSSKSIDEAIEDNNNTPGKRRVSFCESVKVEEIEPNFNKSFSRLTPRIQNRAKLVLSPYFSTKQQQQNIVLSPSLTTNTTSSLISSFASTSTTTTTTNGNCTTSTSLSLSTSSTSQSITSSFNTNSSQSSITASPVTSNKLLNNSSPSVPASFNKLASSGLLPNSLSNQNTINPPSSPGSTSLINFFSNNKQSFLSQRSSIIQQQMLQNQLNKTENSINGVNNNLNSLANSPLTSSKTISTNNSIITSNSSDSINKNQTRVLNEQSKSLPDSNNFKSSLNTQDKNESIKETNNTTESSRPVFEDLKNSNSSIESINNSKNFDYTNYFDSSDWINILKINNITTIGELCSKNEKDINRLPFKTPKLENFLNMIKLYQSDHNTEHTRVSTSTNKSNNPIMGSVEEEMAKLEKLESNSCLDTSIECEALSDVQTANQKESKFNANDQINNSNMEIDNLNNSKNESETNNSKNDIISKFKLHLDQSNNEFNLNDLDLNQIYDLSEYIEELEMKLIQFKRKLRLKIMNKHENNNK